MVGFFYLDRLRAWTTKNPHANQLLRNESQTLTIFPAPTQINFYRASRVSAVPDRWREQSVRRTRPFRLSVADKLAPESAELSASTPQPPSQELFSKVLEGGVGENFFQEVSPTKTAPYGVWGKAPRSSPTKRAPKRVPKTHPLNPEASVRPP